MNGLKKLLCGLLCCVLCAAVVMPAAAYAEPSFGDANDDGSINTKDILTLRSYLADMEPAINTVYADADGSGGINMKDVLLVRKFVADLPVTFGESANPMNVLLSEGKDVRVSLYTVKAEGEFGYELWLGAENLTADKTVEVSLLGVSLNDAMTLPVWAVDLEPGEGTVDSVVLDFDLISPEEGEVMQKVGLYFIAQDLETEALLDCGEQPVTYFVSGSAEEYEKIDRTPAEGVTVLDNSEMEIIMTDTETDEWGLFTVLNAYMENRTDQPMVYLCEKAVVNGQEVDALWISILLPDTSMQSGLILFGSDLTEKGITDIETVAFSLDAYEIDVMTDEDATPLHSYNVTYTAP